MQKVSRISCRGPPPRWFECQKMSKACTQRGNLMTGVSWELLTPLYGTRLWLWIGESCAVRCACNFGLFPLGTTSVSCCMLRKSNLKRSLKSFVPSGIAIVWQSRQSFQLGVVSPVAPTQNAASECFNTNRNIQQQNTLKQCR